MAEQQAANTSGRSLIIFIVGGILLVGLFFTGAQLLNLRNDEIAVRNGGQTEEAQTDRPQEESAPQPGPSAPQNEGNDQPSAEEQQAQAERERQEAERRAAEERQLAETREREQAAEQQATERREAAAADARAPQEAAQTPPHVATTGPSDDLPPTGPATDYAIAAIGVTLTGFGIHRWRQSRLAIRHALAA